MFLSIEENNLLINKRQWYIVLISLTIVFIINLLLEYKKYQDFKSIEIQNYKMKVVNIYPKKDYFILKVVHDDFILYTSISKNNNQISNQDIINIDFLTTRVSFIDYLKGFYTKSINIDKINRDTNLLYNISNIISNQHSNKLIGELFNGLFLAIPIKQELRDHCIDFGISHLIALSGFHLGVLSFIIYWIFYFPYKIIHQKYLPFRNINFDLLIITSIFLFSYLIFLDLVPSLLRAFIMYIFAIFLLRNNLKLISFSNLSLTILLIISFMPKLIFSLSLWLSILGVFYIFLFLKYLSSLNKIVLFFLFNIWIFLALNPIIYQLFTIGSYHQLYSVIFTIGFTAFYPIELLLHIIGCGDLLDFIIEIWLNINLESFQIYTNIYFTTYYVVISLFAIRYKTAFIIMNISFIIFSLYIF